MDIELLAGYDFFATRTLPAFETILQQ